jgi:hypothetical protein
MNATDSPQPLSIAELQRLFQFTDADLNANRQGRYSRGQHRLLLPGLGLLAAASVALLSWPIQQEIGRALGFLGGLCIGSLDLVALLAAIAGLAALWNTWRESRVTPIQGYRGYIDVVQDRTRDRDGLEMAQYALQSDAFRIVIDSGAAQQFVPGVYDVYYVPRYVAERDKLFSMEPIADTVE